jgi:hypothetical protein
MFSFCPFLIMDQNITQDFSDKIIDLIELLNTYVIKLSTEQQYLKEKLNENIILNKMTLDERDTINIFIFNFLKNSINSRTVQLKEEYQIPKGVISTNLYGINEYCLLYQNFISNLKMNVYKNDNSLQSFNEELINKSKLLFQLTDTLFKNHNKIKKERTSILTTKLNSTLEQFKQINFSFFKNILNFKLNELSYNEETNSDINQLLYYFLYHPQTFLNLIKKENQTLKTSD